MNIHTKFSSNCISGFREDVTRNVCITKYGRLYKLSNSIMVMTPKNAILPVSKVRTNKFYIYRQCTYIVYVLLLDSA